MMLSVFFRIFPFFGRLATRYDVSGKKMYALLVPSRICPTYAQKALGTKVILSKGGKSKVVNPTLMNKLMRIE